LLLRLGICSHIEVHASRLQPLVVSLTVVRGERIVDAACSSFGWKMGIDLELALNEDEFALL